jgi:hypothetical protein
MPTSSRHFGLALIVEPLCMDSVVISRRPQRSFLTSPPDTALVRRQSGLFSSRAMGRWAPLAAEGHRPRLPVKERSEAPKAIRRDQSRSQLLLAAMKVTTTRRLMTSMKNTSSLPSVTSSARHNSLLITSRSFSRRPAQTIHTPSSTSSKSAP